MQDCRTECRAPHAAFRVAFCAASGGFRGPKNGDGTPPRYQSLRLLESPGKSSVLPRDFRRFSPGNGSRSASPFCARCCADPDDLASCQALVEQMGRDGRTDAREGAVATVVPGSEWAGVSSPQRAVSSPAPDPLKGQDRNCRTSRRPRLAEKNGANNHRALLPERFRQDAVEAGACVVAGGILPTLRRVGTVERRRQVSPHRAPLGLAERADG
jgi:hypothetical protein